MKLLQFSEGGVKPTGAPVEFDESNLSRLRISDPVMTTIAQGYTNEEFISDALFPILSGQKRTGKFPAFGQEIFKIHNTKRPMSGEVKKILTQTGSVTLSLDEHALGYMVDVDELEEFAGTPDQLRMGRQMMVSESLRLEREYASAFLATTPGNYASTNKESGAGYAWGAGTGNPIANIEANIEAFGAQQGRRPNTIVFDRKAWRLFKNNPFVIDRLKYTGTIGAPGKVTEASVAALFEVATVKIGRAVMGVGAGGVGQAALTMSDVWGSVQTGNVILAWVGNGWGVPSYGYTYTLQKSPNVISYFSQGRNSEIYDEHQYWSPLITLATSGFLMYSIV